jgi:hypothetical protein
MTQNEIGSSRAYSLCLCRSTSESRLFLLVGFTTQGETTSMDSSTTTAYKFVNYTQLIYTPTYTINRALVTTNGISQLPASIEVLSQAPNGTLTNVNGLGIATAFYDTQRKIPGWLSGASEPELILALSW